MTQPKFALPSTEYGRWYEILGEKYVSVTNVIEATESKPFLIPWACKMALKEGDWEASDKYKRYKGEIGDEFHDWAEMWGQGKEPPVPVGQEQRVIGFLQVVQSEGLVVEATEATVFSPELGYAGTLDALMRHPTRGLLTVDYKTGNTLSTSVALQLVALRRAPLMILPNGDVIENPQTDGAAALHVLEKGTKFAPVKTRDQEWEAFKNAVGLALWRYKIAKEVFKK